MGDRNKLGCKDWVEDDRCGCGFSLQAGDADGDGDETRSVVAWGPNALLFSAGRGGAVLARAFHPPGTGGPRGRRLPSAGPV